MIKVIKIALISKNKNKKGEEIDYQSINKVLWNLQKETRILKNKTIQLLWEFYNFSADYKNKHGEYPSREEILGYKSGMRGYIYDRLKSENTMNTANYSTTLETARKQFENNLKEIIKGEKSLIEYKKGQPLELHNKNITIDKVDNDYMFTLSLLSKKGSEEEKVPQRLCFKGIVRDKSTRTILERCIDETYKISGSQLKYDEKKRHWVINLAYGFTPEKTKELDKDKILGVKLGMNRPFMASIYGEKARLFAEKNEIETFRKRIIARQKSFSQQSKMSGEGSTGHGYKTRTKAKNKLNGKIDAFKNTINYKYAKAIVDFAVKNDCGVIRLEKLEGISDGQNPYLKNWSYYDLQSKIENKAAEKNIKIEYIDPQYTVRRCSKCGKIKTEQPDNKFYCECGNIMDIDFNASQNIALKDIEKQIKEELKQTNLLDPIKKAMNLIRKKNQNNECET